MYNRIIIYLYNVLFIISFSCDDTPTSTTNNLNVPIINNPAPVASFIVSPQSGTVDTIFYFDASNSGDIVDSTSNLKMRWDWENDGTWDTEYSIAKKTEHQYNSPGIKTIKLEVIDSGGLTDDTTSNVNVSHNLINLSGKIYDSSSNGPISSARLDVIEGRDTLTYYSNNNGEYSINIKQGIQHEVYVYSFRHADTSFFYSSNIDANHDISLSEIDYYPTNVGSYWKYSFQYEHNKPKPHRKELFIERQIVSSNENMAETKITIKGHIINYYPIYNGFQKDTILIDTIFTLNEQIDSNGSIITFIKFLPEYYISSNFHYYFSTTNKFLHTGIYDTINNPPNLIPCEYLDYFNHPIVSDNVKFLISDNSKDIYSSVAVSIDRYAIIANNIGFLELVYNYGHF